MVGSESQWTEAVGMISLNDISVKHWDAKDPSRQHEATLHCEKDRDDILEVLRWLAEEVEDGVIDGASFDLRLKVSGNQRHPLRIGNL